MQYTRCIDLQFCNVVAAVLQYHACGGVTCSDSVHVMDDIAETRCAQHQQHAIQSMSTVALSTNIVSRLYVLSILRFSCDCHMIFTEFLDEIQAAYKKDADLANLLVDPNFATG
jgi:6-phosphogluconate dehydrogenase